MTGFIAGALLLLAATIGLLAWPLLRRSTPAGVSTRQLTAAVYRNKLAALAGMLGGNVPGGGHGAQAGRA